jgi:hypothetical protein
MRARIMVRKLRVAAAIVAAVIAAFAVYRYLRPGGLELIGGDWYLRSMSSWGVGHASYWHDLYRKSGFRYVRVDTHVFRHRFYAPDCVLFESNRNEIRERTTGTPVPNVIVAACGTHNPVPVEMNTGDTRYEAEGLVTDYPAGFAPRAGTWQPRSTEVIAIDQIRELANRQPAFRSDWRAHASFEMKMP